VQGGVKYPFHSFPLNNIFVTEVKRGKQKLEVFSKQLFGWCKKGKIKNSVLRETE
jgi:hypothetical protein